MRHFSLITLLPALLLATSLAGPARAEPVKLVFSAPPVQSPEQLKKNFAPLLAYLSKASGARIRIEPTRNFFEYGRRMRAGEFDFVLDGPHFVKYRMDKLNHEVLSKQPGTLRFAVVVKKDSSYKSIDDLVNQKVCSIRAPHLSTLTYLSYYTRPARQPLLFPVQSFKSAIACVQNGEAEAAIVRDKYWKNKISNKSGLRVLYITEKKMPARAFSIRRDIPDTIKKRLKKALLSPAARPYLKTAFSGTGATRLIAARQKEYDTQEELLNMVWGFHI